MAWIKKHQGRATKYGTRRPRYSVHWRDPKTGAERSQSFDTVKKAQVRVAEIEASQAHGTYRDPKSGQELLGPYLDRFLETSQDDGSLAPATVALYRSAERKIGPELGHLRLAEIRRADVRVFLGVLIAAGKGAATVQVVHRVLSRVLAEAVNDELIGANPAAGVPHPSPQRKPPRILEAAEVETLADAIEPRFRLMVLVAGYGGLRFGEVAALRRRSVRILQRRIDVTNAVSEARGKVTIRGTKTGGVRSVSIHSSLAEELGAHMGAQLRPAAEDRAGEDLLFPDDRGGPLRGTNFRRRIWAPAIREAGLPEDLGFHDLRHTAAAIAIAQGTHPKALQSRLGHASIRTTLDLYGHLFPGLDEDLADQLEEVHARARESVADRQRIMDGGNVRPLLQKGS